MKIRSYCAVLIVFICAAFTTAMATATEESPKERPKLTVKEAKRLAIEAYIYGYPLVTMKMTRRVMTNTTSAEELKAPMNQFANAKSYPTAAFKDVTAPNADTLYSSAWLDLAKEPYVLHLPDEGNRYYLMPMLSGWTDVIESLGTRTSGTKAGDYAITGPNWKGELPKGLREVKSPTNMLWIIGRTYCTGTPEDYKAVHEIQSKYSLVPLSSYGKPYKQPQGTIDPKIDMKTPVRKQVNAMDGASYFNLLTSLLKENPPAVADAPLLVHLNKIGIIPGQPFQLDLLPPKIARAIVKAPRAALKKIMNYEKGAGKTINNWLFSDKTGDYGINYLQRAYVAAFGLGANLPEDAIYPYTKLDDKGQPLDGNKQYLIHFSKGETPPVQGFWSLTMYNQDYFFVDNPINRYTLSPRDPLKYNEDGSLDLYIQRESPGKEKESNWLPSAKGSFILMMRLYWPKKTIIDGSWKIPGVQLIPEAILKKTP